MWALLSNRLRTWLLVAVALPLLHEILARITARAQTSHPGTTSAKLLTRVNDMANGLATRSQPRRARAATTLRSS